jgi:hypothetical protein
MKITRILTTAALAAAFCLSPAAGQQKPAGLAEMEKLQLLVGTWTYTETYEKSAAMPQGGAGTGTYTARPGPGSFSLIVDFTTHLAPHDEIGHGIITWDPKEKAYKEYIVGNGFPGCFVFTGHWEGAMLVFLGEFDAGGSKMQLKTTYTEWTPKSITILEYFRVGDAPFQLLQTTKAVKP